MEQSGDAWHVTIDDMALREDAEPDGSDPGNPVTVEPGEAMLHASRFDALAKIIEMDDRIRDMEGELFDLRRAMWKNRESAAGQGITGTLARIADIVGARLDDEANVVAMVRLATRRHAADLDMRQSPPTREDVDALRAVQSLDTWQAPHVLIRDRSRKGMPLMLTQVAIGELDEARGAFVASKTGEGLPMEIQLRMVGAGDVHETWRPWDPNYEWAPTGQGGQVTWTDFDRAKEVLRDLRRRHEATMRVVRGG